MAKSALTPHVDHPARGRRFVRLPRCVRYPGAMPDSSAVEELVVRYFRSWQQGDLSALRTCLADEIRFDWGVATYTDPDDFVAAVASGITWRDVTMLGAVYGSSHAAIMYEGVNVTDGVLVRTAEYLALDGGVISDAVVVFAALPGDRAADLHRAAEHA